MSTSHGQAQRRVSILGTLVGVFFLACPVQGGPINSNVAFTPRQGGSILRLQYSFTESTGNAGVRRVRVSAVAGTYVYGLKENLALIVNTPYLIRQVKRDLPEGGLLKMTQDGIGDITVLAKYRFWQNDTRPRETYRLAALGGLNIRSGDSDFTSDSYDPVIGAVFTWRRDRNLLDADLVYRFNTGRDDFRHDTLRYDLAYSYQFAPAVYDSENNYEWNAIAEINGRYTADGAHEVFLSPGLQFISERWALEASLQWPVIQEPAHDGPETDYRLVVGIRFLW